MVRGVGVRLLIALVGGYVSVLGAFLHRMQWETPVSVPWGMAVALVAVGLMAVVSNHLVVSGAAWFAMGWTAFVLVQGMNSSGSYLIGSDVWGWTYMALGVLIMIAITILNPGRRVRANRVTR